MKLSRPFIIKTAKPSFRSIILFSMIFTFWLQISEAPGATLFLNWQIESQPHEDTITAYFNGQVTPVVNYDNIENRWCVDLHGVTCQQTHSGETIHNGPIRMIWAEMIFENPPIMRITIYLKNGSSLKISEQSEVLIITAKTGPKITSSKKNRFKSQPLMAPANERNDVILDLKNAQVYSVIAELARHENLRINFRDFPPGKMNFQIESPSALGAIQEIARSLGMVISKENDCLWFSKPDNPVLLFSCETKVSGSELKDLTLQEALLRLGDSKSVKTVSKLFDPEILNIVIPELDVQLSPRRWIENFLQSVGRS